MAPVHVSDSDRNGSIPAAMKPTLISTDSKAPPALDLNTVELPVSPSFVIQGPPLVYAVQKMSRKPKHKRSRSRNSPVVVGASPLRTTVIPDNASDLVPPLPADIANGKENGQPHATFILRPPPDMSHHISPASKKPFRSSSRQNSITSSYSVCSREGALAAPPTITPPMSDTSTPSFFQNLEKSLDDQISIRTPASEVDIGMLGLDRFYWSDNNEESKVQPSHIKKDSLALISLWDEGTWAREQEQRADIGVAW
ncbi:hypothetical protein HYDPIDRAFT_108552 [Hydnomerulius pinastri MD-312]|nr:hypothetical protein HYDPIDRAFT_108552 [Hydnomerulius pinastri MD-312]